MKDAIMSIQRKRDSTHPLSQKIDDDTFFRHFYLPFVIMDIFYDYVDTVCDQIMILKVKQLKKLMHQIRWFRKDYDILKMRCLDWDSRQQENSHMEFFIDIYSKEFDCEFQLIKWLISKHRKMLDDDWRNLIASVYMAICIYNALITYAKECDRVIESLWGKQASHSIIPNMIPKTYALIKECLGDCDVLTNDDIKSSCLRILEMIKSVKFTGKFKEMDEPINHEPTLYERYLEEKGDNKQAPCGTTRKLMREFQIIGVNNYYKELKKSKEEYELLQNSQQK